MCSTFKYKTTMGRNYDYEISYDEEMIYIPKGDEIFDNNYDIIGIGSGLFQDYPMMYDGMNEKGLCISGLAFTGNAKYNNFNSNAINIAPYELIPTILGDCKTVKQFLNRYDGEYCLNIWDKQFNDKTENAELHWFLTDKENSIIIESTKEGVNLYDAPMGVMTNNPPYNLMEKEVKNSLTYVGDYEEKDEKYYTRGLETEYLDGSYTSMGRFERLVYLKQHMEKHSILQPVNDSFKLLQSVEQIYGLTPVKDGYEYTIYKAVYDMVDLTLYISTYSDDLFAPIEMEISNISDKIERWKL